jgi:hypothetical protein
VRADLPALLSRRHCRRQAVWASSGDKHFLYS